MNKRAEEDQIRCGCIKGMNNQNTATYVAKIKGKNEVNDYTEYYLT